VAVRALERAGLWNRLPRAVRAALARGEEPARADGRRHVAVLLDSSHAAAEAAEQARALGSAVEVLEDADGPLEPVVDAHLVALEALVGRAPGALAAVVSAGEVTLEVRGAGVGGRNQHTVLYALTRVARLCPSAREVAILSAGTDGRDGPTDAAGAVASLATLDAAAALGLDPADFLANNDAYSFFRPLGALVTTGPTGTNVRDLRVLLARGRA